MSQEETNYRISVSDLKRLFEAGEDSKPKPTIKLTPVQAPEKQELEFTVRLELEQQEKKDKACNLKLQILEEAKILIENNLESLRQKIKNLETDNDNLHDLIVEKLKPVSKHVEVQPEIIQPGVDKSYVDQKLEQQEISYQENLDFTNQQIKKLAKKLENQVENVSEDITKLAFKMESFRADISTLKENVDEKNEVLKSGLANLETQVKTLTTSFEASMDQISVAESAISENCKKVRNLETRVENLEETKADQTEMALSLEKKADKADLIDNYVARESFNIYRDRIGSKLGKN